MRESRRRAALARELWRCSRRGRREVALHRCFGEERPLVVGRLRGVGPRAIRVGGSRVPWARVRRVEASPPARCPNCLREHGPLQACLVGVIAGVIEERGTLVFGAEQLAQVEVDELWDLFGGPAVDWLEDQLRRLGARDAV
jgi:hypothetical protein